MDNLLIKQYKIYILFNKTLIGTKKIQHVFNGLQEIAAHFLIALHKSLSLLGLNAKVLEQHRFVLTGVVKSLSLQPLWEAWFTGNIYIKQKLRIFVIRSFWYKWRFFMF